jgi:hypothetical protein
MNYEAEIMFIEDRIDRILLIQYHNCFEVLRFDRLSKTFQK